MTSITTQHTLLQTDNLHVPTSQVVLIYTEWNEEIIQALVEGAKAELKKFSKITVTQFQVPGCVEITHAIKMHYQKNKADAYIALGCVIRGETPHFDYVCQSVTQGITILNTVQDSPVIYGILTVNKIEEAHDRLGGKHGHKGKEAAIAAIKMISLKQKF